MRASPLPPLLLFLAPAAGDSEWHVDPITVKIAHTRRGAFPSSAKAVDLAGMRGECERAQLWGWDDDNDLSDVTVTFAALSGGSGASLPAEAWSYKQQGYVNASTPNKYLCAEDILAPAGTPPTPPPPPIDKDNCSLTPWNQCWCGRSSPIPPHSTTAHPPL